MIFRRNHDFCTGDNLLSSVPSIKLPTDDNFDKTGLKQASLIRIGKLATVEESILQGVLGEISAKRLERILTSLSRHLGNDTPST